MGHLSCGIFATNPHGPSVLNRNIVAFSNRGRHTCAIADDSTWRFGAGARTTWTTRELATMTTGTLQPEIVARRNDIPISINAGGPPLALFWTTAPVFVGVTTITAISAMGLTMTGMSRPPSQYSLQTGLWSQWIWVLVTHAEFSTTARLTVGATTHSPRRIGGSLGDGSNTSSRFPRSVSLPSGRTAISIDVGIDHTCAILDDSSAVCWGLNERDS